jgi:biopolymer transport protein TolR
MKRLRVNRLNIGDVSLVPLIDTFATLLVIFMVTSPMVQNSIKVDLPQGKCREVGMTQELVVTLSKDNKLFFNSYPVERKKLVVVVQKALEHKEDTPVFVRADQQVAYGKIIEIVDELKQANVKYVAMSTRPLS